MRISILSFAILTVLMTSDPAFAGNPDEGFMIFNGKGNCKTCHHTDHSTFVGPGLEGVTKRHTDEWLRMWLSDPQKTWEGNHVETIQLKQWKPGRANAPRTVMKIRKFSEEDIENIIAFLKSLG